jgi:hypothetical protein
MMPPRKPRPLSPDAALLTIYDQEMHLEVSDELVDGDGSVDLVVGDTMEAVRGNGPREGQCMGTATVSGFDDDGDPVLDVRFDGRTAVPREGTA